MPLVQVATIGADGKVEQRIDISNVDGLSNIIGTFSITSLVVGVTARIEIKPYSPSKALSHWAIYNKVDGACLSIDTDHSTGLHSVDEAITTSSVVLDSSQIIVKFFDGSITDSSISEGKAQTVTAVLTPLSVINYGANSANSIVVGNLTATS